MKKIIALIFLLLLCVSVVGCGGMPGEKAAGLYPDIIGNWGTDPFGEEFVLTLSKDGTCTVLDNPGTWTLDEKRSHEKQVTLTAKTEHTAYSIQLDRVSSVTSYVHLIIMDAKEELVVYEDDVFTPKGNVISYDLALQSVPELVGEWGSFYWNEESALTIREDGTCSLLRQPGRWCLRSDNATWPNVTILIKLDSGEQYRGEFQLYPEAPVFYLAALDIMEAGTGFWAYPTTQYYEVSINRTVAPSTLDIIPEAVGTWAAADHPDEPLVTFNEDGTCTILGGNGVWSIQYAAYLRNLQSNLPAGSGELTAKINDNPYTIYFNSYDDGRHDITIYNSDMNVLPRTDIVNIQ